VIYSFILKENPSISLLRAFFFSLAMNLGKPTQNAPAYYCYLPVLPPVRASD
jgi:hypothetical protein